AAMAQLKRTVSAGITEAQCLTLEEIAEHAAEGTLEEHLIPVDEAVNHLPAHRIPEERVKQALQGQRLSSRLLEPPARFGENIRLYGAAGQFLGIFRGEESTGAITPVKVFPPE